MAPEKRKGEVMVSLSGTSLFLRNVYFVTALRPNVLSCSRIGEGKRKRTNQLGYVHSFNEKNQVVGRINIR